MTLSATPVFNTSNLAECFDCYDLALDDQGLFRRLETVLLPHSRVELLEKIPNCSLWKIKTEEYPYEGNHFVDGSFLRKLDVEPRSIKIPSMTQMLEELKKLEGTQYVWGSNWPDGIDFLPKFYRGKMPFHKLKPEVQNIWRLKGVDCSGLLYYVSNGYTPRNTFSLLNFGRPVEIEGLSVNQIMQKVQPLDVIVWPGHVVCVFSRTETIESRAKYGVVRANLSDRLSEILKERKPVIRRWHPQMNRQ
jgi:hypothetical protein